MSNAAYGQHAEQRKTLSVQSLMLLVAATAFWLTMGLKAGIACLFGGVVVVTIGWLERRQQQRAAHIAGNDPAKNLRYLYRCAAERFVATVALFAAGFGLMALPPLPLLGGYIIARVVVIYRFYQVLSLRRRHG
ncbi:MAG: ATP synthase subunit I [Chromatiales bacterium]|nr:ATP synthase subunit I [Chromatiales bacterium]